MSPHEQKMFNEQCDRIKAYEYSDRTIRRLCQKLEPLSPKGKIFILQSILQSIDAMSGNN